MRRKRKIPWWLAADKEALVNHFVVTSSEVPKARPWPGQQHGVVPSLSGNAQLPPPPPPSLHTHTETQNSGIGPGELYPSKPSGESHVPLNLRTLVLIYVIFTTALQADFVYVDF